MTIPGHSCWHSRGRRPRTEFHAPLEDQAKENHYFGGKETREAEELAPGDSPVVDNEGGNSPPSNLHDRAVGEAIAKCRINIKVAWKTHHGSHCSPGNHFPEAGRQLQEVAGANGEAL